MKKRKRIALWNAIGQAVTAYGAHRFYAAVQSYGAMARRDEAWESYRDAITLIADLIGHDEARRSVYGDEGKTSKK